MPGPPPPETEIVLANRWPDFTTSRPSEPSYLPTSKPAVTVNERPSRTRDARLLPPSPTVKWLTSTSARANVTWLGCSRAPLIRASAVRDGSAPPHIVASSQLPSPPFHSTVVPALNADTPATIKTPAARTVSKRPPSKLGKRGEPRIEYADEAFRL